jgi:hypothetical protein
VDAASATTPLQKAALVDRRSNILKKLQQFRRLQAKFMPGLKDRIVNDATSPLLPEQELLHFPSSLASETRNKVCLPHVTDAEERLRLADTHGALEDMRRTLQTRTWLNHFKIHNVSGVAPNTRARALQKGVNLCTAAYACQYRRSQAAYLALKGSGDWERTLRPLLNEDVCGFNERAFNAKEQEEREQLRRLGGEVDGVSGMGGVAESGELRTGEGRRKIHVSWIWLSGASPEDESDPKMRNGE